MLYKLLIYKKIIVNYRQYGRQAKLLITLLSNLTRMFLKSSVQLTLTQNIYLNSVTGSLIDFCQNQAFGSPGRKEVVRN